MSTDTLTDDALAGMSDDELMKTVYSPQNAAGGEASSKEEDQDTDTDAGDQQDAANDDVGDDAGDAAADAPAENDGDAAADDDNAAGADDEAFTNKKKPASKKPAEPAKQDTKEPAKVEGKVEDEGKGSEKPADASADEFDYKAAYEKLMGPIKANGKEMKLENIDEAIKLIQQGANYTKKMQALQPNLKLLRMLENQGLLDEAKLTRLIDLDKKNPAAIKQMVKDSGLDPLELDNSEDPGYKPGNYRVSDEEMRFTSTVEEVASEISGKELITSIQRTWDESSKKAIWADPDILRVLTTQRKNGIYGQIIAEVDRRKVLGYVPVNEPFLETYQRIGQELDKAGKLVPASTQKAQTQPSIQKPAVQQAPAQAQDTERQVLERSTPAKKPTAPLSNSDKARAASATKVAAPKKPGSDFNPLAISDEDFAKYEALGRRL